MRNYSFALKKKPPQKIHFYMSVKNPFEFIFNCKVRVGNIFCPALDVCGFKYIYIYV